MTESRGRGRDRRARRGASPGRERENLGILRELSAGNGRIQLALIAVLCLLATASTLLVPWMVGKLLKDLDDGGMNGWTWLLVGVGVGSALANAGGTFLLSRLGQRMIWRLRVRTMRHALGLRMSDIRAEGSGNLVARITADTARIKRLIDAGPIQLPMAVVMTVGTLVIMGIIDWPLLLVTLGAFSVAGGLIVLVVKALRRQYTAVQEQTSQLAQQFVSAADAVKVIKSFQAEEQVVGTLDAKARQVAGAEIGAARMEALMNPVVNLGQQIAMVAVIVGGGARLIDGHLSMADFVSFLLYLLQLTGPLMMASSGITAVKTGMVARERFNSLFAMEQEGDHDPVALPSAAGTALDGAAPAGAGRAPAGTGTAPDRTGTAPDRSAPDRSAPGGKKAADARSAEAVPAVEFAGVDFSYGAHQVLHGADFQVPARGLTAMVGLSGSGKTTSLELIQRFAEASGGSVRLFGHEAADWPLRELRGRMAYLDQASTLVQDTVRRNLTLGRDPAEFSDERLMAVLEQVGLAEEIAGKEEGLDTVLAGNSDLSGGQRQRLGLARAVLSEAPLILLDEPSSQLDSVNEQKLRDVVDTLAEDRAVLVVAHRISTVQHADHVMVFEGGRVVGRGAHESLMRGCPQYEQLVAGQALISEVAA